MTAATVFRQRARDALLAGAVALLASALGCSAPLPTYPRADGPASLRIIAARQAAVHTLQSDATVELTRPGGESVTLDAAVVIRNPSDLRVRAWKLDRAVFDATIRDGEIWLVLPDDPAAGQRLGGAEGAARGLRSAAALLGPSFFESATIDETQTTAGTLVATGSVGDAPLACTIDRPTLTPRTFRAEAAGDAALTLTLDRYEVISGIAWPTRLTIESKDGRVVVTMHDVVLNGELEPAAFVPPRRAVRQP